MIFAVSTVLFSPPGESAYVWSFPLFLFRFFSFWFCFVFVIALFCCQLMCDAFVVLKEI